MKHLISMEVNRVIQGTESYFIDFIKKFPLAVLIFKNTDVLFVNSVIETSFFPEIQSGDIESLAHLLKNESDFFEQIEKSTTQIPGSNNHHSFNFLVSKNSENIDYSGIQFGIGFNGEACRLAVIWHNDSSLTPSLNMELKALHCMSCQSLELLKGLSALNASIVQSDEQNKRFQLMLADAENDLESSLTLQRIFRTGFSHISRKIYADIYVASMNNEEKVFFRSLRPVSNSVLNHIVEKINSCFSDNASPQSRFTVNDIVYLDDPDADQPEIKELTSVIVTPLKIDSKNEILGMLLVGSEIPRAFRELSKRQLTVWGTLIGKYIDLYFKQYSITQELLAAVFREIPHGIILLDSSFETMIVNDPAKSFLKSISTKMEGNRIVEIDNRKLEVYLQPPLYGIVDHEIFNDNTPPCHYRINSYHVSGGLLVGGWILVIRDMEDEDKRNQKLMLHDRLVAVGQLAAGIAHDFNNLLTSMIGFAELLQMRSDIPESAFDDLKRIVRQGNRAAALIQQILDFSRKSISHKEPADMIKFVEENIDLIRSILGKNIILDIELDEKELPIRLDTFQMQQVLRNIIENSREAILKEGRVKLNLERIRFGADDHKPFPGMPDGEWVSLSIADNGQGIPNKDLPHIFEPFFTTKTIGEGSGLGLAQVYGIIKQHNGFIVADSHPGEGTCINIYLPLFHENTDNE